MIEMVSAHMLVKDLMKLYNKSYNQVVYALSTGRIKGSKVGWVWVIAEQDLPDVWPVKKGKGD